MLVWYAEVEVVVAKGVGKGVVGGGSPACVGKDVMSGGGGCGGGAGAAASWAAWACDQGRGGPPGVGGGGGPGSGGAGVAASWAPWACDQGRGAPPDVGGGGGPGSGGPGSGASAWAHPGGGSGGGGGLMKTRLPQHGHVTETRRELEAEAAGSGQADMMSGRAEEVGL